MKGGRGRQTKRAWAHTPPSTSDRAVTRYLRLDHKLAPHRRLQAQRLLQVPRQRGHRARRARQGRVNRGGGGGVDPVSRDQLTPRLRPPLVDSHVVGLLRQRGRGGGEEGVWPGDGGQFERDCLLLLVLVMRLQSALSFSFVLVAFRVLLDLAFSVVGRGGG